MRKKWLSLLPEMLKLLALISLIPALIAGFLICDQGGYIWEDKQFEYVKDFDCQFSLSISIIVYIISFILMIPIYIHWNTGKRRIFH